MRVSLFFGDAVRRAPMPRDAGTRKARKKRSRWVRLNLENFHGLPPGFGWGEDYDDTRYRSVDPELAPLVAFISFTGTRFTSVPVLCDI